MSVEVTTADLFEQIGRLFTESRKLAEENQKLSEALRMLQQALAERTQPVTETGPENHGNASLLPSVKPRGRNGGS